MLVLIQQYDVSVMVSDHCHFPHILPVGNPLLRDHYLDGFLVFCSFLLIVPSVPCFVPIALATAFVASILAAVYTIFLFSLF